MPSNGSHSAMARPGSSGQTEPHRTLESAGTGACSSRPLHSASSSEDRARHPGPGLWWTQWGKACERHWETALVPTCCPQEAQHCPSLLDCRASRPFGMEGTQHSRKVQSWLHIMSHHLSFLEFTPMIRL